MKKRKNKDKIKHKNSDDFQTFVELLKNKYKKHRVYNVKSDSEIFDDDENNENKESKNIAALSKNIVSKISEFNWVADSDVFLHMIDQLQLFSESLICIKKCIIKVEKRKLYVNHCNTAVMQDHYKNSVKLFFVLHVSKLKMNLLFEKRMCKKDLQESFDNKDLYMHDKRKKQMIETLEYENIYIVKRIANDLDEFALLSVMQCDISSAFSVMHNSMNLDDSMNLDHSASHTNVIHHENEIKVDHDQLSFANDKSFKLYKLWHHCFAHLESAKLHQLHKIITLKKPILINNSHKNVCEICALIKFINKWEYNISNWKTSILTFIFINIYELLLLFLDSKLYFLEIMNNHFRKTWCISLKQWFNASNALQKWKLSVKFYNNVKLLSVHSDNIMKLKVILNSWCSSVDITS